MPWQLAVGDYGVRWGLCNLPVLYTYKASVCNRTILRLHCATSKSSLWNMEYVARGGALNAHASVVQVVLHWNLVSSNSVKGNLCLQEYVYNPRLHLHCTLLAWIRATPWLVPSCVCVRECECVCVRECVCA